MTRERAWDALTQAEAADYVFQERVAIIADGCGVSLTEAIYRARQQAQEDA